MSGPENSRTVRVGGATAANGSGSGRPIQLELALAAAAGALLAFLGPFGTYDLPAPSRLAYWLAPTLAAYFLVRALLAGGRRLALRADLDLKAGELPALVVAAAIIAASLLAGGTLFSWPLLEGEAFELVLVQVGVIGLALYAAFRIAGFRPRLQSAGLPSPAADDASAGAAFFDRLPISFGRDILCLEMEDHYVRAHNDRGSVLVLMTMREAVAQLGGVEGLRVGRSWWVAREAVVAVDRRGRGLALKLSNGLLVPVPRSRKAVLREKGWV